MIVYARDDLNDCVEISNGSEHKSRNSDSATAYNSKACYP